MQNISLVANLCTIWLCKKISTNEWAEPIEKKVNIAPTNSDAEIKAFGASYVDYLRIKCSQEEAKQYTAGDRVYYNRRPPLKHNSTQTGVDAGDYTVQFMPTSTINIGTVYLKKAERTMPTERIKS